MNNTKYNLKTKFDVFKNIFDFNAKKLEIFLLIIVTVGIVKLHY